MRYLIVNADDFGQSRGINQGITQCYENGVVTSASLMVRWPAAAEACAFAKVNTELSVGLHVDLGEWRNTDGDWRPVYEVVPLDDEAAVREEVKRQVEWFKRLLGRGPSHLDSHQHVHLREPVRSVLRDMAEKLNVPLRHETAEIRYSGDFYGQSSDGSPVPEPISLDGLLNILGRLDAPITELACHPGRPDGLDTMYRSEREAEVQTLTDPRVGEALERLSIRLCSFTSVPHDLQTS